MTFDDHIKLAQKLNDRYDKIRAWTIASNPAYISVQTEDEAKALKNMYPNYNFKSRGTIKS